MTREAKIISPSQTLLKFRNGTQMYVAPFAGAATQWANDVGSFRSFRLPAEEDTSQRFQEAMAELDIYEQETIHLDVTGPGQLRAFNANSGNDQVVLQPAQTLDQTNSVKVVLYQDESGGMSWHFPDGFFETANSVASEVRSTAILRTTVNPVFTIPTRTVAARQAVAGTQQPSHLRGFITKWGRKIFKVLVLPIAADLLAKPLELIVGKIESKYRRDLIRSLTVDNYRNPVTTPFDNWAALNGKRNLLVLHGIFSSTEGVLSLLPRTAMAELEKFYEGRIIALDQLTVSKSPEDNAKFFLQQAAQAIPGGKLEFDILCHSRGGIVARTLAERSQDILPNHPCTFNKVYFAATPNQGSMLADPAHIVDMLDVFTNLLTNFPDGPILYSVEVFLAMIKLLAYTAERSLPGLASMGTDGYINQVLNSNRTPSPAAYASSSANYTPDPNRDNAFFSGRFANYIIDRVFTKDDKPVLNDLVVPRDGVYAANGHPSFPIQDPLIYKDNDHVWHTGFFEQPRTINHILKHFGIQSSIVLERNDEPPRNEVPHSAEDSGGDTGDILAKILRERESIDDGGFAGIFGEGTRQNVPITVPIRPMGAPYGNEPPQLAEGSGGDAGGILLRGEGGPDGGSFAGIFGEGTRQNAPITVPMSPMRSPYDVDDEGVTIEQTGSESISQPIIEESLTSPIALQRVPLIIFHEQVTEGVVNDLTVCLEELDGTQKTALDNLLDIAFAAGEISVDITVTLNAPGFDLCGPPFKNMQVKRHRDPKIEQIIFQLIARNPPGAVPTRREITASFYLRNSCIGSVTHRTVVVPKNYQGVTFSDGSSDSKGFVVRRERREDCDLIINVVGKDESSQPPFRIHLRSELPDNSYSGKDAGQFTVPGDDLTAYLNQFYQPYIAQFPKAQNKSKEQFQKELKEWEKTFSKALDQLGKKLWDFLPQGFRSEYFKIYLTGNGPRSIVVHSDEMIFPWELVVPYDTINGKLVVLPPLGISHILGRWKAGLPVKPVPQNLPVHNFCILNPSYTAPNHLPWSLGEIKNLKQMFPKQVFVVEPANLDTVQTKVLDRSDIQILHFSGHGEYEVSNADLSKLLLEGNESLDAIGFTGTKLCAESSPIVYLNACSVGSTGLVVGRMGGFAANFLSSGCSGVIAPYWPINDARAAMFSVLLYQKLQKGRSIGEALQELRSENPHDPNFRAFSFFGDPWTRINFSPS